MIGRGVSVVLIILILHSPYLILQTSEYQQVNESIEIEPELSISSITTYDSSVLIMSDSDFVLQHWPGNGTESSPYLIANLRFSNAEYTPITICYTRAHFVVNNCIIEPPEIGQPASDYSGIQLIDVSNGIIENCKVNAKEYGINVWHLNDTIIRNNQFSGCDTSIYIDTLRRCSIFNNTIYSEHLGIEADRLEYCNVSGNTIVECLTGIVLNSYCINNTLSQNRIGWCTDASAVDFGSGNIWTGNSWSDWNGVDSYLISGSAGSIDDSPSLFDEDVLGPTFEFRRYGGIIADLIEPLDSFTFIANVSDASGVASVTLFIRERYVIDNEFQFKWVEYIMNHQPIAGNPDRYTYTFDCDGSFRANYVFFANDTLGHSRFTEVDSFSFGCCLFYYTGYPLAAAAIAFILLVFGAVAMVILVRRYKS